MQVGGISVVGSYSAIKGEDKITVSVDTMTDIFDSSGGYEHTQPIISREGGKIVTVFDAIGFGTLRHSVTSSPEKVKVARDSIGACFFLGKIPTSSPAGVALELHAGAVIAAGLTAYMDTTKFIPEFLKECPPDALKYASIGSVRIAADTLKRFYPIESIRQDIVEVLLEEKEASCAVTYSKQAGLFPVCIVPATQMEGRQECDKVGQSYLREYVLPNLVASGLCRLDGVSCQFLGCVLGQDCRAYMSVMKAGHILLIPVDSVSCSYREYDDKVEVIWLEKGTMYSLYLYMEDHKKSVTYHALSKHSDTGMVYGISELAPYVASPDYRDSLESKISTRRLRAKERVANMCKYVTLGRELNTVEVLDKYFVVIATADVSKDGIIKVAGSSYKACSPIYYTKDELPTESPDSTRNPLI